VYFGLHLIRILLELKELNLTKVLNVFNGLLVAFTKASINIAGKIRLISCLDEDIAIMWQKREI